MSVGSPFKSGGAAKTLPLGKVGSNQGKLIIRCNNDDPTNRIHIRINGLVDSAHVGTYLMGGEALTIQLDTISPNAEYPVTIISTVNDPDIYWSLI